MHRVHLIYHLTQNQHSIKCQLAWKVSPVSFPHHTLPHAIFDQIHTPYALNISSPLLSYFHHCLGVQVLINLTGVKCRFCTRAEDRKGKRRKGAGASRGREPTSHGGQDYF